MEDDSVSETVSSSAAPNTQKENSESNHVEADLLGLDRDDDFVASNSSIQGKSESENTAPIPADPDDLDSFFQGGGGSNAGIACSSTSSSNSSPLKSRNSQSTLNSNVFKLF